MSDATETVSQIADSGGRGAGRDDGAGFLWDFWYPALRSEEITGRKLATAMLLEVPLVLGRTSEGKAFAIRDSCPHRGIPLSYGRFDGKGGPASSGKDCRCDTARSPATGCDFA